MAVNHVELMAKEFDKFRYKHDIHRVFEDFLESIAITISNRVNPLRFHQREARYLQIAKKYERDELDLFAKLFALLINALTDEPNDYLGLLFMRLELYDSWKGQFFTPYSVASLMSELTIRNELEKRLQAGEIVRINDSAVGGGVTLIAAFNTIRKLGFNPQQVARFYANDIDKKAVHMCYIQLSLLGVNGTVWHCNTLTLETWDKWLTPGFFFGHGNSGIIKQKELMTVEKISGYEQLTLF